LRMSSVYHQKLVRDKIPQIIRNAGRTPVTHVAGDDEYLKKLKTKLVEEAQEFKKSGTIEELADVLEVIKAICKFRKFRNRNLELIRQKKEETKGGFGKRIILDKIE